MLCGPDDTPADSEVCADFLVDFEDWIYLKFQMKQISD